MGALVDVADGITNGTSPAGGVVAESVDPGGTLKGGGGVAGFKEKLPSCGGLIGVVLSPAKGGGVFDVGC